MRKRTLWLVVLGMVAFAADETVLLRPAAKSILKPGSIEIIARDKATVDGKPVPGAFVGSGAFVGNVRLAEGLHVIEAGGQKNEVYVGDPNKAPAGFKLFRPHPPSATACTACHMVKGDRWAFKNGVVGDNCMECHDAGKFPKTHTHTTQVLQDCQICHSPHGSIEPFHLKFQKETVCKQCHG